tara:strand:- start:16279 stop:16500 length:222 start_codon:yes stop_codon:yes gene_type:complete
VWPYNKKLEDLEELMGGLEFRVIRMEKDLKGLYLFIDAYIERVEEDERALDEVKPMLAEVGKILKSLVKGLGR